MDLQFRIKEWSKKTFSKEFNLNPDERWIKLLEEMYELEVAFTSGNAAEVIDELADVQICLYALANSLNVNLVKAVTAKLFELEQRVYEFKDGQWIKVKR